jgi:transketolase
VEALFQAMGGHYGGSLSVLDILLTLYRTRVRASPQRPRDPRRDRVILSKGHAAMALYAVLRRLGLSDTPLGEYGSLGSPLEGHPDMTVNPAVDFSTGSLGQGLSVGLGMALALRGQEPRIWVVLGDGECQEGQVWEAALLAARLAADHLIAVIDANGFQEWGWSQGPGVPEPVPDLAGKWAAFGWRVLAVDGHDHEALAATFADAAATVGRPTMILTRTVKGKGVPLVEADPVRFHCTTVTDLEHAEILRSLS